MRVVVHRSLQLSLYLSLVVVLCLGCVSIPERTRSELEKSVHCDDVDLQMARLSRDHAAPGQRFIAGLQGLFPISVVVSLVRSAVGRPRGMYLDHWRVAFGSYNQRIEDRMDALQDACDGG